MDARVLHLLRVWIPNELRLVRHRPRFVLAVLVLPVFVLPLLLQLAWSLEPTARSREFLRVGLQGQDTILDSVTRGVEGVIWSRAGHQAALLRGEVDVTLQADAATAEVTIGYLRESPRSVRAMLELTRALQEKGMRDVESVDADGRPGLLVAVDVESHSTRPSLALFAIFAALAVIAVVALTMIEAHSRDRTLRTEETMAALPYTEHELSVARFWSIFLMCCLAALGFAVSTAVLQLGLREPISRLSGRELLFGTCLVTLMGTATLGLLHGIVVRLRSSVAPEAPVLLLVPVLALAFAFGATRVFWIPALACWIPVIGTGRLVACAGELRTWMLLVHLLPAFACCVFATRKRRDRASIPASARAVARQAWVLVACTWIAGFVLGGALRDQDLVLRSCSTLFFGMLLPTWIFLACCRVPDRDTGQRRIERRRSISQARRLAIAFLAGAAVVGVLPAIRGASDAAEATGDGAIATLSPEILFALVLLPAFVEEFVFRGVLLRRMQYRGLFSAVLVSSLVFALHHYHLPRIPGSFAAGLLFAWVQVRTRSWIFSAIAHSFVNGCAVLGVTAALSPLAGALLAVGALAGVGALSLRSQLTPKITARLETNAAGNSTSGSVGTRSWL